MANRKDYYRMRYGQAGMDPTDNGEPQSVFDARATDFGADDDTKVTTIKENKKGTTKTEVKTKGSGEKLTLSSFFPTIVPSEEERIAAELANRDILSGNKPRGVVMGDQGYANADNTMTMPTRNFGEKSASGNAMLSDAGIKLIAEDFQNKRAKKAELNKMSDIFDRINSEKEDNYFNAAQPPTSIFGNNSFNYRNSPLDMISGKGISGDRKAVQNDYKQTSLSEADQSMFDQAKFMRSPTDAMDDTADVELGITTVNDDGTVDPAKLETLLSKEQTKKAEDTIITSPAAVKSIQQLEKELKALENNPEARKAKYLDFLRENGVLKEWRPDLFKALASTAFRLAMGDSTNDAFTYSFGRMQEKADAAQVAADKAELERIKKDGDNDVEFGKNSTFVNLGTTNNPIKVATTVRKDGVPVVSYKGKILTYDQLASLPTPIIPRPFYEKKEIGEHFNKIVDSFQKDISSLVTSGRFKEGEDVDKYVNILKAKSQIMGGLKELEADGVDIGPGMDTDFYNVLTNAAADFIDNKTNPNSKLPDKTFINFVNDRIVKAKINRAGIDEYEFLPPEFKLKYEGNALVPTGDSNKDRFELQPQAWEQMKNDSESWFRKFYKENPNLKGIDNVAISRDFMGIAHAAYEEEKAATGDNWMIEAEAGYKAGYLPFMYWLRSQPK